MILLHAYIIGNSSEARIEDEQIGPRQAYIGGIAYGGYARKVLFSPFRTIKAPQLPFSFPF